MREIRTRVNPSSAVHPLRKKAFCEDDGLHRNSGPPEFRITASRKSGEPDLHRNSGPPEFRITASRKSGEPDLHRNSGPPEFRITASRKSGEPDLRCQARQ